MAKMKLYYSPGSPYARKVRVVALETRPAFSKFESYQAALSSL
jgi:glutathione S-transferase